MFSKYEVTVETWSIYFYKDHEVLKNKLNIKDAGKLKAAETEITTVKIDALSDGPIKGRLGITHLSNIHKYIFEDLYAFAGKLRREDIWKGKTRFCSSAEIKNKLQNLFSKLKEEDFLNKTYTEDYFDRLGYYMAELNYIHPFREGNGRTIREYIRQLALENGVILNWSLVQKEELLEASIDSVYDRKRLVKCLRNCCVNDFD